VEEHTDNYPQPVPAPEAPNEPEQEPVPFLVFCASLMALVYADGRFVQAEENFLHRIAEEEEFWQVAKKHWKSVGTRTLLLDADRLFTDVQKLCLIANMLDCAMADDVFSSREKFLIEEFRKGMHVEEEQYDLVMEVVWVKNDFSCFLVEEEPAEAAAADAEPAEAPEEEPEPDTEQPDDPDADLERTAVVLDVPTAEEEAQMMAAAEAESEAESEQDAAPAEERA